jgi:O-antigen/teichoic acid export membrane protein
MTVMLGNMSIKRHVIDTLFSLVGINLFIAGLSFVTTIFIANTLGKETFGDFSYAVAIGTYGLMFVQFGLEKSLVRFLVHYPMRFGELLKASLLLRSLLFIIFVLFLGIALLLCYHELGFSRGIVLVIFATTFQAFQLAGVYDAWKKMKRHAVYVLIERCTYFGLIWCVILVPFLSLSIELIGACMITAIIIGFYLQYRWALPRIDFKSIQGMWPSTFFIMRSNIFIWFAVISGLSIDYLTQIILKWYTGSAVLGEYSVAWKIMSLATLFLSQAGRIGSEAMARHTRPDKTANERFRFLAKYVALMAALGFLIGLPCLFFSPYILKVFRPEYASAAETLRLFGLYPLLFGPYLAVLQYAISSGLQITYFVLITIAGLLSIGLNLWLIPQMQSKGAVISVIISLAVALILFSAASGIHLIKQKSTAS